MMTLNINKCRYTIGVVGVFSYFNYSIKPII